MALDYELSGQSTPQFFNSGALEEYSFYGWWPVPPLGMLSSSASQRSSSGAPELQIWSAQARRSHCLLGKLTQCTRASAPAKPDREAASGPQVAVLPLLVSWLEAQIWVLFLTQSKCQVGQQEEGSLLGTKGQCTQTPTSVTSHLHSHPARRTPHPASYR